MPQPHCSTLHPWRGYCKIVGVSVVLGAILGLLITLVREEMLNDLRRHLTVWLIIAIVAIINITSFMLFALFWAIYRWIKRDLEPVEED